jgi:hypothetical protein
MFVVAIPAYPQMIMAKNNGDQDNALAALLDDEMSKTKQNKIGLPRELSRVGTWYPVAPVMALVKRGTCVLRCEVSIHVIILEGRRG